MQRRSSPLGLAFVLIAIVVIGALIRIGIGPSGQASPNNFLPPKPLGVADPNHGKQSAGHRHAIVAVAKLVQAHTLPTFTVRDVENYLRTDPVAQEAFSKHLTHTVTFISASDLSQELQDDFSRNASILCYVEFTGDHPFVFNAVRMPAGATPPQFTKVYEVFDGLTGDMITWGALK